MNFSPRIQGFFLIAGFATVVLAAQTAAVSRPAAASPPDAPVVSTNAADQNATPAMPPATSASDGCDAQHWPYYSGACLRGEASGSTPRQVHLQQVHLQPASSQEATPAPVAVASAEPVATKSVEPRPVSEMPRRRKARKAPHYASRPVLRVRQIPVDTGGSEQALAFSW